MPAPFAWEMAQFYFKLPSEPCFYACLAVAKQTKPVEMPGLVVIETIGAPMQLAYTEYPDWEKWLRLERAYASRTDEDHYFLNIAPLH